MPDCIFCQIVAGEVPAHVVLDDEVCLAFLDMRPVFPGHVLLIPKAHHETLVDLPPELVEPLFSRARLLAAAVPAAVDAVGTFVAVNNKVSQSVPHVHVHVVPRRPKDGLRGFFWPRQKYEGGDDEMASVAEAIRSAAADLTG
ncbi:MAG: histidine triad protein [Acidimicrobiales bacterium]|nr:histidine triad protein [Acidimicrobiales bacterium]